MLTETDAPGVRMRVDVHNAALSQAAFRPGVMVAVRGIVAGSTVLRMTRVTSKCMVLLADIPMVVSVDKSVPGGGQVVPVQVQLTLLMSAGLPKEVIKLAPVTFTALLLVTSMAYTTVPPGVTGKPEITLVATLTIPPVLVFTLEVQTPTHAPFGADRVALLPSEPEGAGEVGKSAVKLNVTLSLAPRLKLTFKLSEPNGAGQLGSTHVQVTFFKSVGKVSVKPKPTIPTWDVVLLTTTLYVTGRPGMAGLAEVRVLTMLTCGT